MLPHPAESLGMRLDRSFQVPPTAIGAVRWWRPYFRMPSRPSTGRITRSTYETMKLLRIALMENLRLRHARGHAKAQRSLVRRSALATPLCQTKTAAEPSATKLKKEPAA